MSQRTYERLLAGASLMLTATLAARAPGLGDYPTDAGPALAAVAHGDVGRFFSHQPAMGSVSLFARAPFAALAAAIGDGRLGAYRWGTVPCLIAVSIVALWLARIALRQGSGRLAAALIVAIALLNPLVNDALYYGHPEELLTASLAIGALVAACEQRPALTALLAGLAIASKQWALLIIAPAVLALERERIRALLLAGGVAVGAALPMIVANPGAFRHALRYISNPQPIVTVFTWLYPASPSGHVRVANIFGDVRTFEAHRLLGIEATLSRPMITAISVALPVLLWWRGGRRLGAQRMLLSTAIVFVLRCALDPGSAAYYHFQILFTLLVLDAIGGRIPYAGLSCWALVFVVLGRLPSYLPAGLANAAYIVVTVIACGIFVNRLRAPADSPRSHVVRGVGRLRQVHLAD
jgi:hypothetical protein